MPSSHKSLTQTIRDYLRARAGMPVQAKVLVVHTGATTIAVQRALSQLVTQGSVVGPGRGRPGPEGAVYTWPTPKAPKDEGVTAAVREAAPVPFREPDGQKRTGSGAAMAMPPIAWPFRPLDGVAYVRSLYALRRST